MSKLNRQGTITTGIDLIDDFQVQMVKHIENLRAAASTPHAENILDKVVEQLSREYPDYYRKVDTLLKKLQFPQVKERNILQQELAQKIVELKKASKGGQKIPPIGVVGYLKQWIDRFNENNQELKKFLLYNKDKINEIKSHSTHHNEFVTWQNSYNTGLDEIDSQHQQLVEFINRLNIVSSGENTYKTIHSVIKDLVAYTQVHFRTEEGIMTESDYPDYEEHKKKHVAFIKEITSLMKEFKETQKDISVDLLHLLKDWLLNHIKEEDNKLARYIEVKTQQASV